MTIISQAAFDEALRKMTHGHTMENLRRLRDGKQKTMRRSKIYCRCDACSTLTELMERERRLVGNKA